MRAALTGVSAAREQRAASTRLWSSLNRKILLLIPTGLAYVVHYRNCPIAELVPKLSQMFNVLLPSALHNAANPRARGSGQALPLRGKLVITHMSVPVTYRVTVFV